MFRLKNGLTLCLVSISVLWVSSEFSGNARLNPQRGCRQTATWPNQYKSKNGYRSLRVNGLFGGGKKDNSEDGQSKVHFLCMN